MQFWIAEFGSSVLIVAMMVIDQLTRHRYKVKANAPDGYAAVIEANEARWKQYQTEIDEAWKRLREAEQARLK